MDFSKDPKPTTGASDWAIVEVHDENPPEWNGPESIAHITRFAEKQYFSLPDHIHDMLKRAAVQLQAHNSITPKQFNRMKASIIQKKIHEMSGVEQYEWARYKLDAQAYGPFDASKPIAPHSVIPNVYSSNQDSCHGNSGKQTDPQQRPFVQNEYIKSLLNRALENEITYEGLLQRRRFRTKLSNTTEIAMKSIVEQEGLQSTEYEFALSCIGCHSSGCALKDSDLDLVLKTDFDLNSTQHDVPRVLRQAFLKAGFGAILVRNENGIGGRILLVCETPSPEVLETLKNKPPRIGSVSGFQKPECGVQARIYLRNCEMFVHTTSLLRCYRLCDFRIQQMGIFIRSWTKARRINDPQRGFLSSYGYHLMMLHYLMNVADPPVIPNLQRYEKGHRTLKWVNGNEVLYWCNEKEIMKASRTGELTDNRETTEFLLRGFFAYYSATQIGPRNIRLPVKPFNWARDVVSIRDLGVSLQKNMKGWTQASTDELGVRRSYLLAIEDPFQPNHNVASKLNIHGLRCIRNEFERADFIINRVQLNPGSGWEWKTETGVTGSDFFAAPETSQENQILPMTAITEQKQLANRINSAGGGRTATKPMASGSEACVATNSRKEDNNVLTESSPFQLDPAQLRDIATIQAGGNGCKRVLKSAYS